MSMVEVAKLAGVSHATVSRVINGRSDVSAASVQRVREAMQKLRYVPPAKRRGPKPKASKVRTGNIGVLFFSETPTLATSQITAYAIHAIEQEAAANGFSLMIGQVTAAGGLPKGIAAGHVDGLLLHGLPPSSDIQQKLARYSACVWILSARRQRGYWGDRVSPDNQKIGEMACRYLVDRGHRRIAAIDCDRDHHGFASRTRGFTDAAREAGVAFKTLVDDDAVIEKDRPWPNGSSQYNSLIDQLVAGPGPMPTGLFVPRDVLTIQLYRVLRRRGIEPGRDIEIISCDNIPALDALDPRPATIDVRPDEIGRRAVEQLIWRINQRDAPLNVTSMVEPKLVPAGDPVVQGGAA
jgi:LacI family transcriptional regulator